MLSSTVSIYATGTPTSNHHLKHPMFETRQMMVDRADLAQGGGE